MEGISPPQTPFRPGGSGMVGLTREPSAQALGYGRTRVFHHESGCAVFASGARPVGTSAALSGSGQNKTLSVNEIEETEAKAMRTKRKQIRKPVGSLTEIIQQLEIRDGSEFEVIGEDIPQSYPHLVNVATKYGASVSISADCSSAIFSVAGLAEQHSISKTS